MRFWYDGQREVHRQIFEGEESVDYAFIGTNPDAADNPWLREAMEPLVRDDYDRKLPVEVLRSGDRVELLAVLTFGSGVVFKVKWRRREENGEQRERAEKVS